MLDSIKNNEPKVTICVVTYNQEMLIEKCLRSIIDQKTDFEIEIIVSDDCSNDKTRMILENMAIKYSNISLILREENIGALENFKLVHSKAKSQYVCHCDGDDYWLPGKLQAQADYLDLHPNCNVLFTRTLVEYDFKGELIPDLMSLNAIPDVGFNKSDVLRLISLGVNSSKMYRRKVENSMHPDIPIVDYYETVEQVGDGTANYVSNDFYTVYRAGIGIACQGETTRKALHSAFIYFADKYPNEKKHINVAAFTLFISDFKNNRSTWKEGLKVFIKTFDWRFFYLFLISLNMIKILRNP